MFVVTLPLLASKNPRAFALKAKRAGAQILEIRGDITPDAKAFASPLPLLVAPRGAGLSFIQQFKPSYVDLDTTECLLLRLLPTGVKMILSMHDYKSTPALTVLKNIVQKMYSLKPWMIKLATNVTDYDDLLALWDMQNLLNKKSIRSSVLGMGEKAHLLRITSPIRNCFTYAYLDGAHPSAVGQLPLSFYQSLPRVSSPALFGIIGGSQISSSLSPAIHNALFCKHKIDALYSCFPTDDFKGTVKILQRIGVVGFSVTAPFKKEAFKLAKKHDALTENLGVANTLVKSGSSFSAFNTDVYGIEHGYPELKRVKNIAILGAGGALPSAILAARRLNSDMKITVFARDTKKAARALQKFCVVIKPIRLAIAFKADAVICAVSEDVRLPLPKPSSKSAVAIDLRYGKTTAFMHDAKKQGYRVCDGMPMLVNQAQKQFEHFTSSLHGK
ncbi:type I 3-dehydroquinate dehydratase [Candidatus Peribacteria bacterium]|nr:type I 3-dehydroquinate dehydratase [Candidatus Peribacteria bacterium]